MTDTRTGHVTAFLSVYQLTRHYGGPEEGGWWYDAWEHTGAAFPYEATQEFHAAPAEHHEQEDGITHCWVSEDNELMKWAPEGNPVPLNQGQADLLKLATEQFTRIYGAEGTGHRYSTAPRGDDFKFVHELHSGQHETKGRPRYE